MIPTIPWYIETIVLTVNVVVAISVWRILSSAAGRSGLVPAEQRRIRIGAGIFLGVWLGAALLLAPAPHSLLSRNPRYLTPLVPLFLLVGISTALLAIRFSPALRRVLASASLPTIIGVQVYRSIGVVFLILLAQGQLPPHFAQPAGWGDVIVGVSAPLVALLLARGIPGARPLALAWNGFGLLDLIVAVGMGSGLLLPLLAPQLGGAGPAAAMGVFPLVLVPTFAVPVSVLLHLIAVGRLLRSAEPRSPVFLTPAGVSPRR